MEIRTSTCHKGMVLITGTDPGPRVASLHLAISAGSAHEVTLAPFRERGYAHLNEHLTFRTPAGMAPGELARRLAGLGDRYNASTSRSHTHYTMDVVREDLPEAAGLLLRSVLAADFSDRDLARERKVVLSEMDAKHEDNSPVLFLDTAVVQSVGPGPLSQGIAGTVDHVRAATREDLLRWRRAYYIPANAVLCVVSSLPHEAVRDIVESRLVELEAGAVPDGAGWPDVPSVSTRPLAPLAPPFPSVWLWEDPTSCTGVELAFTRVGPRPDTDEAFAMEQAVMLLTGTGTSPYWKAFRQDHGLAYHVDGEVMAWPGFTLMAITTEVQDRNLEELLDRYQYVHANVKAEGTPSEEEVRTALRCMGADMAFLSELSSARAEYLVSTYLTSGKPREMDYQMVRMAGVPARTVREYCVLCSSPNSVSVLARSDRFTARQVAAFRRLFGTEPVKRKGIDPWNTRRT